MHLNDWDEGVALKTLQVAELGAGGEIKKKSEGQKYATTVTCNTWWWALRTCLTLGSSGLMPPPMVFPVDQEDGCRRGNSCSFCHLCS